MVRVIGVAVACFMVLQAFAYGKGCVSSADCARGEFCRKKACGGDGVCAKRPQSCIQVYAPVCGCDGRTYSNACMAYAAGVNIAYEGECGKPLFCPADGDVAPLGSRDGKVNIGDALVTLRFALGLEVPSDEDKCRADVAPLGEDSRPNPDGKITIGDALVILRKALGLVQFETRAPIWRPAPGTTWQWQLTGKIDTSVEAEMFDVDLFNTSQETIAELHRLGRVVICYFSAGTYEPWRPDADKFSEKVLGKPLSDWPDERWLDIRKLDVLGPIMEARLDLAVEKGCDGVEPDNVDAYQNDSGFPLTYEDQLRYNLWLAREAHTRGLSVGLKNDLDQIPDLEPYFDWALNEECFYYNECDKLLPFVKNGKAVFQVEYELGPEEFCSRANAMGFSSMRKNYDLDAWRIPCWDFK